MISRYYGKKIDMDKLRNGVSVTREGLSLLSISETARSLGFKTVGIMVSFEQLGEKVPLPCIAHWGQEHFVVIWRVRKRKNKWTVYVADPAIGLVEYDEDELSKKWHSTRKNDENRGIVLLMEPTPEFFAVKEIAGKTSST
jgi:ATP-binding cassette subfamily B protein